MPTYPVTLTARQDFVLTRLATASGVTKGAYGQGIINSFFENQIRGFFRNKIENMDENELVAALGELDYGP